LSLWLVYGNKFQILRHRVSGAPVVDQDRLLLGVFSERDSMNVLIKGAYDQLPSAEVSAFMNTDPGRVITEETDLLTIAQMFVSTSYRRLPVVRGGILQGQISRRDVLRNSRLLSSIVRDVVAYAQCHAASQPGPAIGEGSGQEGSEAARAELSATSVVRFVDSEARTITEDVDLLSIAQIFSSTPFRRLPVLRDGRLVGQVSRKDVLSSVYDLIQPGTGDRPLSVLYLSGVLRDGDAAPEIQ
jgi:CBS domain-containing protein